MTVWDGQSKVQKRVLPLRGRMTVVVGEVFGPTLRGEATKDGAPERTRRVLD
jgi:hypothetical protein